MKKLLSVMIILMFVPCAVFSESSTDPFVLTNAWKRDHGYDFPIYGSTSVDLSPISDYLSLLEENKIYLKLPELGITHNDDYEWIYSHISDSFYLTYVYYFDGIKSSLSLEVPNTYRPKDKALVLLMVSFLALSEEDAEKMYISLQYNVVNQWCEISKDNYTIVYNEPRYKNGTLMDFVALRIEKEVDIE